MEEGALVAYKSRPAVVEEAGERPVILTPSGRKRVRQKDLVFLHPGPAALPLSEKSPPDLAEVYEVAGEEGELEFFELLELVYPEATPAEAWALYEALSDSPYFELRGARVRPRPREEVQRLIEKRRREEEERARFEAAIARFREGKFAEEDKPYLAEVEALALGRAKGSRVLRALGLKETPEEAHALLLRLGYWTPYKNPYPDRYGVFKDPPAAPFGPASDEGRVDLTHLEAFAIDDDPASADADDALSFHEGEVLVHVADVAAWVRPNSEADQRARERGSALYLPEGVVPMLPPSLLAEAALGQGEKSRALTFAFRLEEGVPVGVRVFPSWVRVKRLSYAEAEERLEDGVFRELYALAEAFYRRRLQAGALDISLPEVKVLVEEGRVVIRPLLPYRSRFLVRELMLAAGEAAARYAEEEGIPFPFSTQEKREVPEDLPEDEIARGFALRKVLSRTVYKSTPLPHAGLGLLRYAQVTSPLRRYLDLVAHQQLWAHLAGRRPLGAGEVLELVGQAEAVAGALRQAERASRTHFKLVWLLEHPGFETEGVVVEERGNRVTVFLPELALEVALAKSGGERVGERRRLRLAGVDLPYLKASFSWA